MNETLAHIAAGLFVFAIPLGLAPLLIWLERRICAGIQSRIGPNRVGPMGLLQPLADVIKLMFKEDITPSRADKFIYVLGPLIAFIPTMLVFGVVPVAAPVDFGFDNPIPIQAYDFGLAVVVFLAILSVGVYGVAFGAWASNNKYSLLGGLRSVAQMISYELVLTLTVIWVIMVTGTVSLADIVAYQEAGIGKWLAFEYFPFGIMALILFFTAALAENKRLPFDLPEAEAELVGGFHTEYSSMKFAMFFMGEYIAIMGMSALFVTMFLGGWSDGFGLVAMAADKGTLTFGILSFGVFMSKFMIVILAYIWIRWTLPRFRYDIVMTLSWKRLVPLAFVNLIGTGIIWYFWPPA